MIKALDMTYEQFGKPQRLLFHFDQGAQSIWEQTVSPAASAMPHTPEHLTTTHPAVTEKVSCRDNTLKGFIYMVSQAGFEPATFPLGGGCSIQLSY